MAATKKPAKKKAVVAKKAPAPVVEEADLPEWVSDLAEAHKDDSDDRGLLVAPPGSTGKQAKSLMPPAVNGMPTELVLTKRGDGMLAVSIGPSIGVKIASIGMSHYEANRALGAIRGRLGNAHARTDSLTDVPPEFYDQVKEGDREGLRPTFSQLQARSMRVR